MPTVVETVRVSQWGRVHLHSDLPAAVFCVLRANFLPLRGLSLGGGDAAGAGGGGRAAARDPGLLQAGKESRHGLGRPRCDPGEEATNSGEDERAPTQLSIAAERTTRCARRRAWARTPAGAPCLDFPIPARGRGPSRAEAAERRKCAKGTRLASRTRDGAAPSRAGPGGGGGGGGRSGAAPSGAGGLEPRERRARPRPSRRPGLALHILSWRRRHLRQRSPEHGDTEQQEGVATPLPIHPGRAAAARGSVRGVDADAARRPRAPAPGPGLPRGAGRAARAAAVGALGAPGGGREAAPEETERCPAAGAHQGVRTGERPATRLPPALSSPRTSSAPHPSYAVASQVQAPLGTSRLAFVPPSPPT